MNGKKICLAINNDYCLCLVSFFVLFRSKQILTKKVPSDQPKKKNNNQKLMIDFSVVHSSSRTVCGRNYLLICGCKRNWQKPTNAEIHGPFLFLLVEHAWFVFNLWYFIWFKTLLFCSRHNETKKKQFHLKTAENRKWTNSKWSEK